MTFWDILRIVLKMTWCGFGIDKRTPPGTGGSNKRTLNTPPILASQILACLAGLWTFTQGGQRQSWQGCPEPLSEARGGSLGTPMWRGEEAQYPLSCSCNRISLVHLTPALLDHCSLASICSLSHFLYCWFESNLARVPSFCPLGFQAPPVSPPGVSVPAAPPPPPCRAHPSFPSPSLPWGLLQMPPSPGSLPRPPSSHPVCSLIPSVSASLVFFLCMERWFAYLYVSFLVRSLPSQERGSRGSPSTLSPCGSWGHRTDTFAKWRSTQLSGFLGQLSARPDEGPGAHTGLPELRDHLPRAEMTGHTQDSGPPSSKLPLNLNILHYKTNSWQERA